MNIEAENRTVLGIRAPAKHLQRKMETLNVNKVCYNLSTKNRLRDMFFSSKSRQATRQGFLRDGFKTGPETGFQEGQVHPSATCPVLKTVTGPVSRTKTQFYFPV